MTSEAAILIWLPIGDVPQEPSFAAAGAVAYSSLADALTAAYKEDRPEVPWISTTQAVYSPEKIRLMADGAMDGESD